MVSSEYWFGAEAGFYNDVATQSLRFNDDDSAFLSRTPSSATNRKTFTWSGWVKRGNVTLSASTMLFTARTVGNGTYSLLFFEGSTDYLYLLDNNCTLRTSSVYRDCSAWYHIVLAVDTTQATDSNRLKLYVNGTQITDFVTATYPSQNTDLNYNSTATHFIGKQENTQYFDGYLAEINFVDGYQYDPTYFGETKNGVWIPKAYSGSYGTNGFRLEFKQTGLGSGTSTTIGADTSGNDHHFTSSGIVASDCNMPDSPENNFATMDSVSFALTTDNIAEGNLRVGQTDQFVHASAFAFPTSGKWYWEVYSKSSNGSNYYMPYAGVCNSTFFHNEQDVSSSAGDTLHNTAGFSHIRGNDAKYKNLTGTSTQNGTNTATEGQAGTEQGIVGFALDVDAGTLKFYWNNSLVRTDSTLTAGDEFFAFNVGTNSGGNLWNYNYFNFGQDSSFSGTQTAQGNKDANGNGDFYYSPPSSHLALCTSNLPEPTISPNSSNGTADEFFNTVLYTGNESTQSITGVGFRPDWLWIKQRSTEAQHHVFNDSNRGVAQHIYSNLTNAEATASASVSSFDSDGWSMGANLQINRSSRTYVAWNWKAGGATPTKTYKVVVVSDSGNKYRFRNSADSATFAQSAVTLDLQEGGTYTFDWSDSTAQGHPIRFSLTSDGTHGGGSEYTTGVVKDDSAYTTTITVASGVATLYYYCQNHSGMGGQINTNTTFGSTNFDGSILSVSNVNTTSSFSIITYTGNATAGATVGHGLGVKPAFMIFKSRSSVGSWYVYHEDLTADNSIYLNLTNGSTDQLDSYNDTEPTSSIITFGNGSGTNPNSNTMVGYIFSEVEGFSKFGVYTGNGSADGTFVYTGFRPAWLMIKRTNTTGNWIILDATRSAFNVVDDYFSANATSLEASAYYENDFLSNGFKARRADSYGDTNANGSTYIYMAFAETPFKYANAR